MTFSRTTLSCWALLILGPGVGSHALGQVPPDSVPPDTLAAQDTLPEPHNLPLMPAGAPEGFHTGVWEWDREDLLATRAQTLDELLVEIPGVIGLRGGDYGMPRSVSAFGVGGGRIRVFWEGVELPPLEGGVPDLARIGLGGIARVRVERRGGELRVELRSLENEDPRPYSLVEVGTGELDTNLFRGTFSHPRALGGSVALALDRIDTEGPARGEPGSSTGGWLRYALHGGDRVGLALEMRRLTSDRDTLFEPAEVTRTDLAVRGRAEVVPDLVVGAFYGSSSLDAGGESEEDTAVVAVNEEARSQVGLEVGLEKPGFWAEAGYTIQNGEGWPSGAARIGGGARWEGIAGAQASLDWEDWSDEGESATRSHLRGWTEGFWGLSVFGELHDGKRGVPFSPAPPLPDTLSESPDTTSENESPDTTSQAPPLPALRFTDRRFTRYGVRFNRWGLSLGAARMRLEVDSLAVLGLPTDREGVWAPGGVRKGFELSAELPLLLGPLRFLGAYQDWDDDPEGRWRYFPDRTWDARLNFHDTYFDSEDLELWVDVGVQGRDPMAVPLESEASETNGQGDEEGTGEGMSGRAPPVFQEVPTYQSWYLWVEIRIVSVRIFIRSENLINKDDNFDFPGRRLPGTRTIYGVRWTLWN